MPDDPINPFVLESWLMTHHGLVTKVGMDETVDLRVKSGDPPPPFCVVFTMRTLGKDRAARRNG